MQLAPHALYMPSDLGHQPTDFAAAYDHGKNDGFDLEGNGKDGLRPYTYVPQSDVQPYWTLAQQYTIADDMFQSNGGPSFAAHQYLIAGQTGKTFNPPGPAWGCDSATKNPPCFNYKTLGAEADAAGVTWRYYSYGTPSNASTTSIWQAYDAVRPIRYGADWTNGDISEPETNILGDISAGTLAQISWVTPAKANSDHPGTGADYGPDWVTSITNAVASSQYSLNTTIIVLWDDWGGFYDHVVPPQLDAYGLGFRVPMILIGPTVKTGYVSHVQHEYGSILNYIEQTFGLPSMGTATEARSDNLSDCFTSLLHPIRTVKTRIPNSMLMRLPQVAPDDDDR